MKPWALIPAPLAHEMAPFFLSVLGKAAWAAGLTTNIPSWGSVEWHGLHFPNPVGLAAGVDKDARNLNAWWGLGAGFLEIGTVTPLAQKPNPGKIIKRDFEREALWNRLGFPSQGQAIVRERLSSSRKSFDAGWPTPVFVNIGKNRTTLNSEAWRDYASLVETFYEIADALVINISSPNTTGLRQLLEPQNLKKFLLPIVAQRNACASRLTQAEPKPLLLKLSPDMSEAELRSAIQVSGELGMNGWILTNTTLSREKSSPFPSDGGVSGAPVAKLSEQALRWAVEEIGGIARNRTSRTRPLLISTGGILNCNDVDKRLDLGADLVQVYSTLILRGPGFFLQCAKAKR